MYLEISNVAAAIGKNPYESREKLLLISWARHAPSNVVEYLLDNECIAPLEANEEYSNLHNEVYKNNLPETFDVKDFTNIEEKIVQDFKKIKTERKSYLLFFVCWYYIDTTIIINVLQTTQSTVVLSFFFSSG